MPWFITVPGLLAAAVAAGFLLLAAWMRLHEPAAARQYLAAFAREHVARAAERVLEEVSR
jgi:hypothetical protein